MKWNRAHRWKTLPTDSTLLSITKLGAVDKCVVCNVYLSNKMHSLQYKETKYKSRQHFIRKAFRDQSVSLKYKRKNMTTGYIFHSCKCIWHKYRHRLLHVTVTCYCLLQFSFHGYCYITLLVSSRSPSQWFIMSSCVLVRSSRYITMIFLKSVTR